MDQQSLVADVLENLFSSPEKPTAGNYLAPAETARIVDATLGYIRSRGDQTEYHYLKAHRKRLAESLSMVPLAETSDASFLEIGCHGFMGFWAFRHLGYSKVEGVEFRPDREVPISERAINFDHDAAAITVHNVGISAGEWSIKGTYDTISLLETLEYVKPDPMGILTRISHLMNESSRLLISVPNALSYTVLHELLTGTPSWNHWFFHPDSARGTRRTFEYSPISFKILIKAAGFSELAFRTLFTLADKDDLSEMFEIAKALSIDPRLFGDTVITQVKKPYCSPPIRYPDCIYNANDYHRTTHPLLELRRHEAVKAFLEWRQEQQREAEVQRRNLEARIANIEARAAAAIRSAKQRAEEEVKATSALTAESRLVADNNRLEHALSEATLANQRANDAEDRERKALERAKEADARTSEALTRFVREQRRLEEALQQEQVRAHELEARITGKSASAAWRVAAQMRRLSEVLPRNRLRVRSICAPLWGWIRKLVD